MKLLLGPRRYRKKYMVHNHNL